MYTRDSVRTENKEQRTENERALAVTFECLILNLLYVSLPRYLYLGRLKYGSKA